MTSNIQQNTDNSQQTDEIACKGAEDIIHGSKAVNEVIILMKNIAEHALTAHKMVTIPPDVMAKVKAAIKK